MLIEKAEFAAEVEKMKAAQPKGGRPKNGEKPGKKISSVKEATKTATTLARAAGTNRAYLETAAKLPDDEGTRRTGTRG
jgi:hypothetical protein